jgi:hypothetical protein
MKCLLCMAGLLIALSVSAEAAEIEGIVTRNGGDCAIDGTCALDVKASGGGTVRFVWGWEAPIIGCSPDAQSIRAASKLRPGQKMKVTVPDRFASVQNNGVVVYYLCEESSVLVYRQ